LASTVFYRAGRESFSAAEKDSRPLYFLPRNWLARSTGHKAKPDCPALRYGMTRGHVVWNHCTKLTGRRLGWNLSFTRVDSPSKVKGPIFSIFVLMV
ncbi:MAG: hypothetical protein WD738_15850, partial [Pirellulales bacterium]